MTDIPAHILPLLSPEQAEQYRGYLAAMSTDQLRTMRLRAARRRKMLSTVRTRKITAPTLAESSSRTAYSTK